MYILGQFSFLFSQKTSKKLLLYKVFEAGWKGNTGMILVSSILKNIAD